MSRQVRIASIIWGVSALLSRVIGLIREAVLGRVLGGGHAADAYLASFSIADYFNYLLAGGALSLVFIPIFSAYLTKGEEDRGWEAFSVIANFLVVMVAILLPPLWLAVPWLAHIAAPGFTGEQQLEYIHLTRILLPAQVFHILGGLLSASLQARDRHGLPAMAPLVYTVCVILGGLIGQSAEGFAWGVLAGAAVGPFGLLLVGNLRAGMHWRLIFPFRHPDLRTYLWKSLPIMLAFSLIMVDDWILANQGSLLDEGAIATLRYAKNLMRVPMGIFGFAAAQAAFPTLSRLVSQGSRTEAYTLISTSVRRVLVLALGAEVAMTAAGAEISEVIYGGRVEADQHHMIGLALGIFCLGLWAWSAQNLIARGFYAVGKTWLPSVAGTLVVVVMLPVYYLLRLQWGTLGLAMATTLAISVYMVALTVLLRKEFPGELDGYGAFALRALPAVGLGIAAGVGLGRVLPIELPLLRGAILGTVAAAVYVAAALAIPLPEARAVGSILVGRLRRRWAR